MKLGVGEGFEAVAMDDYKFRQGIAKKSKLAKKGG